ncbi:inositol -1(or 4)-monophosphatase 2 [Cyclospora cayetanensis]|uniref:Inositol-1(Or 4)-monophosphatase 2 n=1 Tax=Cyclospora cayetanensis TaxID=88456 RepID=A0A1D3D5G6_9EIME|nr:inositol -1(or 4)-monophosphatase 2 [Cyclospora cayetanensis]
MADGEVTLQFVRNLAESVGPLILEGFGCGTRCKTGSEAKTKASAADLVTEFDTGVEERLKAMIQEAFPHHAFLCEGELLCLRADGGLAGSCLCCFFPVIAAYSLLKARKSFLNTPPRADGPDASAAPTACFLMRCLCWPAAVRFTRSPPPPMPFSLLQIDGTTNFVHGLPFTCVSIAFARDKRVLIGVVFSPVTKELFSAERGHGATLNGAPLKASSCTEVGKALACVSFGVSTLRQVYLPSLQLSLPLRRWLSPLATPAVEAASGGGGLLHLPPLAAKSVLSNVNFVTTHCRDIRHFGSTALELCYLGMGKLPLAIFLHRVDMAAGSLILEEAGAVCSDMRGNQPLDLSKHQVLAAATPELLKAFAANLKCPC